jgi:MFS family permease
MTEQPPAPQPPAPEPPAVGAGPRSLRPLAGVLAAMGVSQTGTRISAVALPWFVLSTTGSAAQTGLVAFCEMTPYVVVKALTGPLVDRAGPRRISWSTDLVSASAAAAIPVLHILRLLPFWLLLVLVVVIGAARGPGDLAKAVMIPEVTEHGRIPLERATGVAGVVERLAKTVGPAAGGSLVALLGPLTGLVGNAVCFTAGSLIIALALPRGIGHGTADDRPADEHAGPHAGQREGQGYWRRFGEGLAGLRGEPLWLTIVVMVAVTNLLDTAFNAVLLPVWARNSGAGPAAIGLTGGAAGGAAICGSLIAAAAAHRMPRRPVFFGGFLVAGAPPFLILALDLSSEVPMWVVLAGFAVAGFGGGFLNPLIGAIFFERVPRHLLGRVKALGDSLAWAGMPLGGLVAGAAVASTGLVPALIAGGVAYFLTTTLPALRPEWRDMDRGRGGLRERHATVRPQTAGGDLTT